MDDVQVVVTPKKDPPPPRARKLPLGSVAKAIQSDTALEAARLELARCLDDPNLEARDRAGLTREFRIIDAQIRAQGGGVKGDGIDELARKRAARRSS